MRRLSIPAALMTMGMVMAACGSSAPSGAPTQLGDNEDALNLIIWDGYAEKGAVDQAYDWVTGFEDETGCKVNATPMTDSANGVQLLQSGQYDGGSFSGDATIRLMASGDVVPVNVDLIPNYKDVFEGGNAYQGKISVYDSSIYIADAALHLMQKQPDLGITNPYQLNDEQFAAAISLLEQQRDNGAVYWGLLTDQVSSFEAGDTVIGTTWPYQVNLLKGEDPPAPVEATLPDEGSTGWSDTWMIYKNAAHPNCMYRWMNHILSPEANAQATVWFGEAAVTQKACDAAEAILPGHCTAQHASDEAYWDKIWYWTTPRDDCADADEATSCKDQDAWVEAWRTLRGA